MAVVASPGGGGMSFDALAPHYRWMEWVVAGSLLQRCRTAWLGEVRQARRALLAGEGHGRFLGACVSALPHCHLTVVDASRAMLREADRRWRRHGGRVGQAAFQHGRFPEWQPAVAGFDLVVTDFFLDCFPPEQLRAVVERIAGMTLPRARWLVADFAVPARGWRRWRARGVLALAYGFFRVATRLPSRRLWPPDAELARAGFRLHRRLTLNFGLLHADLWERAA
jgi:ubiquinone/menaquinone biosynthesis C-methylase UbiE